MFLKSSNKLKADQWGRPFKALPHIFPSNFPVQHFVFHDVREKGLFSDPPYLLIDLIISAANLDRDITGRPLSGH